MGDVIDLKARRKAKTRQGEPREEAIEETVCSQCWAIAACDGWVKLRVSGVSYVVKGLFCRMCGYTVLPYANAKEVLERILNDSKDR